MKKKLVLIDGYGFVFRAYHSLPPLVREDKTPVGAVYGFTNMLIKLLAGIDASHVAVIFDAGSKTFRNDIYDAYKANRPECPEDLKPQFSIVREAVESLNIASVEKVGFEADDIIATLTKQYLQKNFEVIIVSSDKDLMQLVNKQVYMFDAMRNKIFGIDEVKEKFSVNPNQIIDILSLIGDSSDNVPGVKGIGPKTAAELINEFSSLENIYNNLEKIKQEKRKETLIQNKESAFLSKKLITLKDDVDLNNIDDEFLLLKKINPEKLIQFLLKQGFKSLSERIKKEFNISETSSPKQECQQNTNENLSNNNGIYKDYIIQQFQNSESQDLFYKKANECGNIIFDFIKHENFIDFSISTFRNNEDIKDIYFSRIETFKSSNDDLFANKIIQQNNSYLQIKFIEKILKNHSIKKIFLDLKGFLRELLFLDADISDFEISSFEDLYLINHLSNSSTKNSFQDLIKNNLSENLINKEFDDLFLLIEKNKIDEIDSNKMIELVKYRQFILHELFKCIYPNIFHKKISNCYESLEKKLLKILALIEFAGVSIDKDRLFFLSKKFENKINNLTQEIFEITGEEFNISSSQQLGKILFEKMGLISTKKSKKTKALSTNSEVLEDLEHDGHKIAGKILEFRKFTKLKNTYTDSLVKDINLNTKRVHTHLSSINTITGRLSSFNPNLQNIPVKTIDGKEIRKCFVAKKGYKIISADYSQIELRVIAHTANITSLINAFNDDKDIHRITASQIFNIEEDLVSEELRYKAKAINFGIIYGISSFGLAKQLGITRTEASQYIKSYLENYKGIDDYMKSSINFASANGFVETLSLRRCYIPLINDKNPIIKSEAQRLAINAPIQGSAAEIIKKAMINLERKFQQIKSKSKIILQIHDELLIESPIEECEETLEIIKNIMENAANLKCPLKVDTKISESWE